MGKRKKPEEIQRLLAEADRDLARGLSVADVCRKLGVSEATYHRWRQRFRPAQASGRRQPCRNTASLSPRPLPRSSVGA